MALPPHYLLEFALLSPFPEMALVECVLYDASLDIFEVTRPRNVRSWHAESVSTV